jgi:hypothetical protein|tara:strand:+ start:302 stop:547 length:246 start_codon:yes stop_codon:yes gene_type:complete
MMSYRINISRRKLRTRWVVGMEQYTYEHYFRILTPLSPKDKYNDRNNLTDLTKELRSVYSEPDFKIDVYKETRVPDEKVEV